MGLQRASGTQYSAVAIVLHWAIAAAILANLFVGWWMVDAIEVSETQARAVIAYQLHKSLGLTILVLSLLRLGWRLLHRPPPLPAYMPAWEQFAAKATHWTFYALMLGIPLSGWLYVSTQWRGSAPLNVPTLWFGLFEVPHLLGLNHLEQAQRSLLADGVLEVHEWLARGAAALLILHVAAALKHHFFNRDEVLAQMIPALRMDPLASSATRRVILRGGFALIALAAGAFALVLFKPPAALQTSAPNAKTSAAPGSVPGIRSAAGGWRVMAEESEIAFTGTHAGSAFRGRFTRWQTELNINPDDPAQSLIAATIETGSASDGVPLHDETLPLTEWFDVAHHPQASFRATRIVAGEGGGYALEGVLTIKNHPVVVSGLQLVIDGDRASISGHVQIKRRDVNLGMESDPNAEWVSAEIGVDVRIRARRRP